MKFKNFPISVLDLALFIYFIFFIFYHLDWGAPYYFHPDERNIASSISQLNLFSNLNPHFFAYGSLPIYLVYFIGLFTNFFTNHFIFNPMVSFDGAIIIGRILSAILTIFLCGLIYLYSLEVSNKKAAKLSLYFSLTSVALFQFSHFGTYEIWIAFFTLLLIYLLTIYRKTNNPIYLTISSCILGVLCGLKLSSVVLTIIPIYIILETLFQKRFSFKTILDFIKRILISTYCFLLFYFLTAPFNLLDSKSFMDSMKYEGGVATGSLSVFYTGSFLGKIPILFQYEKILPFLINPVLTLLSIPAAFYTFYLAYKHKKSSHFVFAISFLCVFLSGSLLFAKWTRYIIPAVPFLYISIAIFIERVVKNLRKNNFQIVNLFLVVICLIFSFAFIKTVRIDTDTRIEGVQFSEKNIPSKSNILSEVYDLGIVPFNGHFQNINLFNFYDLDNGNLTPSDLQILLNNSGYIILPSQRIYKSRILDPKHFPSGNKFYSQLFSGKLGFKQIYQTPCDIYCKLTYFGNPIFNVEETADVFDRPVVFIFKRT
ncbi:MAG TPA: hypothetical protein VG965_07085 [Patescibacteria group bacterium]|nr:hypothetical protein [Patescibacteria group bacterium]